MSLQGFVCGFLAATVFLTVSAAPSKKNEAPMERIVENLVKQLPQKIDEAELIDPPHLKFTAIPEDSVISEGSSVTLKCEAEGIPPPTVRWFINDQPVQRGDYSDNTVEKLMNIGKTTIQRGITVSKMSLDCATLTSGGVYKCVAENGHETIEASARLTVEEGNSLSACGRRKKAKRTGKTPVIYMWTDGRVEVSGANAQLYCRAVGEPKPQIQWLKSDGEVIQGSTTGPFDVLPSGDLIIKEADFAALDAYICSAKNVHGEDRVEAFFYPSEPEEIENEEAEELAEGDSEYLLRK